MARVSVHMIRIGVSIHMVRVTGSVHVVMIIQSVRVFRAFSKTAGKELQWWFCKCCSGRKKSCGNDDERSCGYDGNRAKN